MTAMRWYPLKFKPIYKPRIWGGRRLQKVFGKDLPNGEKIGESWELADLPDDKSVVTTGILAGRTLTAVVKEHTRFITGRTDFPTPFPLLIKFLDAQDVLSVQVHPDAGACRRLGHGEPKSECWYIVDAPADAYLYKGLKPGVSQEVISKAITKGTVADLLQKVHAEPGHCHFLPAGTVHALGPGILVAEVQTPSDTTFRVFDWNRLDDKGRSRPLHIQEALESIHFDSPVGSLTATSVGRLVDCPYFTVDKGHREAGGQVLLSPGVMKVLVILTGQGYITDAYGHAAVFQAGDCLLIPAAYEGAMITRQDTEYLMVTV